jgi:hypothetical protein
MFELNVRRRKQCLMIRSSFCTWFSKWYPTWGRGGRSSQLGLPWLRSLYRKNPRVQLYRKIQVYNCIGKIHVFNCIGKIHVFNCIGKIHRFNCIGKIHVFNCLSSRTRVGAKGSKNLGLLSLFWFQTFSSFIGSWIHFSAFSKSVNSMPTNQRWATDSFLSVRYPIVRYIEALIRYPMVR